MKNLYTYKFKVTRIVDGDTVYGDADLGFGVSMAIKVRLFGINTPELRGSEREEGLKAKEAITGLLMSDNYLDEDHLWRDDIVIETIKDKTGKYGRWLGIFWVEGMDKSVNDWLVDSGHAVKKDY